MLSKESKIRVLENFYALDYVLFSKPVSIVETCCPLLIEEYLSVKGALLSVFIEMLKLVDHSPDPLTEKLDSKGVTKIARQKARVARENAQKIVTSKKARKNIKESLKSALKEDEGADISALVEIKIREKAFGLAVDNLLLVPIVNESTSYDKLNDWDGRIIEDSYKVLRDNLVESAVQIIYDPDARLDEEYKTDSGNVASGKAMVHTKGAGTEQAGTGDAKSIPGAEKEKEKDIKKD